ncbi:MAG: NFACT family protein, partial [Planctomycetota bacterium]
MNLNARQIAELCDELRGALSGMELIDIAPLPPRDVLLVFDGAENGKVRRLFVSSNPDASRLHLQQGRMKRGDHPIGPFYAKAMAELVGAKLRNVEQVKRDRIVAFEFKTDEGRRALYAELTGRHANLVLLDAQDRVLEVLQSAPKKAKDVRIVLGEPWKAPGGTPPPHESLPSVEDEYPAPADDPPGGGRDLAPLSWRVECGLGGQVQEKERAAKRREVLQRLRRRAKRARSRVDGLERRRQAASEIDRVQQDGELLKAALGQFERGTKSIELSDWFSPDGAPRRIELDPKLKPLENVERIFTRYRKLQRAAENLPAEIEEATARQAEVEALIERAQDETSDPEEVEAEAMKAGILDKKQTADPRKKKVWGDLFTLVLGKRAAGLDFSQTATLHRSYAYFNATLLGDIFQRMGLPPESLEFLTRGAKFSRPPLAHSAHAPLLPVGP